MGAIKLIRHLRTGHHRGNTRIWIEPVVLEAAGFSVGAGIRLVIHKDSVLVVRSEDSNKIISKRKRPSWPNPRPIFDSCNREITMVFRQGENIDILVSDGMLVIRREYSFGLYVSDKPMLQGTELKKLRLNSFPSGAGLATASLVDTGLFEPVGALDMWPAAVETYLHNFDKGTVFLGDIKKIHPDYIAPADVCWLSPSCTDYSTLGNQFKGVTEGHGPHYARLVQASGAFAVIIEQVPQYFKSTSYMHLKRLLGSLYPYVYETTINAYDMGSVASRRRGYAVLFREKTDFRWPVIPNIPEHRRPTVQQIIGKDWMEGRWRNIEGTVMEGLLRKTGNNNFSAERNRTLVELNSTKISAFPFSYGKVQSTSSYLRYGDRWRPFRPDEMMQLMNLPEWFRFPEFIGEGEQTKLIGQSVDGAVVKAIGIEVAVSVMGLTYNGTRHSTTSTDHGPSHVESSQSANASPPMTLYPMINEDGQYAYQFDEYSAS